MPHLDVFLQDEAAAEGAFSFRAIPRGESVRVGAKGTAQRPRPVAREEEDYRASTLSHVHRGSWENALGDREGAGNGRGHVMGRMRKG